MDSAERNLVEDASRVSDAESYRAWERRCDNFLATLRNVCRGDGRAQFHGAGLALVSTINVALARISRLETVREDLRERFAIVGGGEDSTRDFSWLEFETAFRQRVLTGVIINRRYIDPLRFLEGVRDTVFDRVRENLARHSCLKVNVMFTGEFINRNNLTNVKTVFTKNEQLLTTSDLREWYNASVIDSILSQLEDF